MTSQPSDPRVESAPDLTALPYGPSRWNALLATTRRAVAADSAFVVDGRGLLIACEGVGAPGELASIGNQLLLSFDQVDPSLMGGLASVVALALEEHWVSGLRLRCGTRAPVVGLVGPRPLVDRDRARAIRTAFQRHYAQVLALIGSPATESI